MSLARSILGGALLGAALIAPTPASAAIVPGVAVDGPSADISGVLPRIDVAPDGTAALVYLKVTDGEEHPFVSQLVNGAWSPPAQVDLGSDPVASQARIAVANDGKVAVAYKRGLAQDVVARIRPNPAASFGPVSILGGPTASYAGIDLAPGGNGYAVVAEAGDVFAKRLVGTTWSDVGAGALNNDPAEEAGVGNNAAEIAAAPDGGSAVMAWGEVLAGAAGTDTFARRLTGTSAGPAAGVKLASLAGADPYGMTDPVADQPDVDIDASGTAWVVFRQNFVYGAAQRPRALVRPLTGNSFGAAQLVDGMPVVPTEGRDYQRIDVNGAGQGLITHYGNLTNPFEVAELGAGTWTKGTLVNTSANSGAPLGSPAIAESGVGLVAWNQDPGGGGASTAQARIVAGGLGVVQTVSNPAFGAVSGGVEAAAGSPAFAAITFRQGAAATTRIVAAVVDLPVFDPAPTQPPSTVPDTDRPDVTSLRLSRKRFRLGRALPRVAAVRTGTSIRFRLSEAATVRITFKRARPGRRVRGACRKPTRRNKSRRKCTRLVSVPRTSISRPAEAGARRISFSGRISRRKSLRPGEYQLSLRARDAAGNVSAPDRVRFTLLPRRKRR